MQQQCYIKVTAVMVYIKCIQNTLMITSGVSSRPGDSLVRRQFGFIPSWDQCLSYQPSTLRGSYTKLPCSQCVKHIVRQWLFVNSVVLLWGCESLRVCIKADRTRDFLEPPWLDAGTAFISGGGVSAVWAGFSPRHRRQQHWSGRVSAQLPAEMKDRRLDCCRASSRSEAVFTMQMQQIMAH